MARTVLVLGDQLDRRTGALKDAVPGTDRVVMVESFAKLAERPWHHHKLTYLLSAMRHFAAELRDEGFDVTYRREPTLRDGLAGFDPAELVVMAPSRYDLRPRLERWGIEQVPNDAYIAGEAWFARWAAGRRTLLLEHFYREVRAEHGWLMDGSEPVGGRWNYDQENRRPAPRDARGVLASAPWRPTEDDIDAATRRDVAAYERDLDLELYGEETPRHFPVTRAEALASLRHFVDHKLDDFGPLQDVILDDDPILYHSMLSAPLNLGLLHPVEVCDAVDAHWREGRGPPNSHEGFLRQVCGWREYVWGLYWQRMPGWRDDNALGQHGAVPEFFWTGETDMNCVGSSHRDLGHYAWANHIQRLMVFGNYGLIAGVDPLELAGWFHSMFIDGYDWVMVPNVMGMSQWADGGVMATKPYAATARYVNRMTDYCGPCVYEPKTRTEDDSCPFNALYWDFLDRNRAALKGNYRMARVLSQLERFPAEELAAVRARAAPFRARPADRS